MDINLILKNATYMSGYSEAFPTQNEILEGDIKNNNFEQNGININTFKRLMNQCDYSVSLFPEECGIEIIIHNVNEICYFINVNKETFNKICE